jgi:NitT/TauT family transport system permease protein
LKNLFKIRGSISRTTSVLIEISGLVLLFLAWYLVTATGWISGAILPSPGAVLRSYHELHFEDYLVRNLWYSIRLNLYGYLEAILIAVPLGFVIGLFPFFRSLTSRYIDAIRFIPLTAVTGLFIAWFGIETNMKVQFLAFGIIVYLLPVVVQRIAEVEEIYVQTSYTLGASAWQTIRSVFMPHVFAKISDDIRVLVAISWTYIIVAELINKSGGIGSMIFTAARQSRLDKVFALLFVIIAVGFIQDKIFQWIDKKLFPYKHIR